MTSQDVEIKVLLDLMKILVTPEFRKEKGNYMKIYKVGENGLSRDFFFNL